MALGIPAFLTADIHARQGSFFMSVEYELNRIDERVAALTVMRDFLVKHRADIERIGLEPDGYISEGLDFNMPTREQVVEALKAFGGKWSKAPDDSGNISYSRNEGPVLIRLYRATPPPTCKIVEEEVWVDPVTVPGRMEKRRKLVCTQEES